LPHAHRDASTLRSRLSSITLRSRGDHPHIRNTIRLAPAGDEIICMRLAFLCITLCVACPIESSAELWSDRKFLPAATSFAYVAIHATTGSDFAGSVALRRSEARPSWPTTIMESAAKDTSDRPPRAFSKSELCSAAASVAEANNLPVPFFANLIQQESGFQPHVVSPAGAQGIAQFMPRVAVAYGLTNPFDPIRALTASGKFLAELVAQFGNLGLAAAAYNAGPKRVQDFIAKRRKLPAETRHYVQNITGRPAEQWTRSAGQDALAQLPAHARCPDAGVMEAQEADRAKTRVTQGRSRPQDRTTLTSQRPAKPYATVAARSGRKSVFVAARSGRKSVFVAAGPAAKRFAALVTPAIIVSEKQAGRAHPSRRPSLANIQAAKTLARKGGPAIAAKRVRVAAAR
jgi:hypothetical protein